MTFRSWQLTHNGEQTLTQVFDAMPDADLAHVLRTEFDPEVRIAAVREAAERWVSVQMPVRQA